jgi:hypothetical protein
MTQPKPHASSHPTSHQVLARFLMRLAILGSFATFSSKGFAPALTALLTFATAYCLVMGTYRRESLLGPTLTHFDEAAAYVLAGALILRLF